jgi:hypothetical protein
MPHHQPVSKNDYRTKNGLAKDFLWSLARKIFAADPYARIMPFPSELKPIEAHVGSLKRGHLKTSYPYTVRKVNNYLFSFWLHEDGHPGRARLYLYHRQPIDRIIQVVNPTPEADTDSDLLEPPEEETPTFILSVSQLQSPDIVSICWLQGTSSQTDLKALAEAIMQTTEFKSHPEVKIFLQIRIIKVSKTEQLSADQRVPAAFIMTAREHYFLVDRLISQIYHPSKQTGFPLHCLQIPCDS